MTPSRHADVDVRAKVVALAAFALSVACGCCADKAEEQAPRPAPIQWTVAGTFDVAAKLGTTATITIDIAAGQRYIAIRTLPVFDGLTPSESTVCYQVDRVTTDNGTSWVENSRKHRDWGPACQKCTQRTMSMPGVGVVVFPNDGGRLMDAGKLSLRVVLRDCTTGVAADDVLNPDLPARVRVAFASEPNQPDAVLRLNVVFVDPLPPWADTLAKSSDAHDRVASLFSDAGVLLAFEFSMAHPMSGRYVPIRFKKCDDLAGNGANTDLLGASPRIPGGMVPAAFAKKTADGVFLASDFCDKPQPTVDAYAALLAHELGHYLGLYHSNDSWGQHRAAQGPDLMHSAVLGIDEPVAFTAKQWAVIRAHPYVWSATEKR